MSPAGGIVSVLAPLAALHALGWLPFAAAQAPVLPNVNLQFNISVPLGVLTDDLGSWSPIYDNTSTIWPGNGSRLGNGPYKLHFNTTFAKENYMQDRAQLLIEGLVINAYVFGDIGRDRDSSYNVTFQNTDTTDVANQVEPPKDGKGLIGKVEGLEPFRRSTTDQLAGYNGLWCFLYGDWTKKEGRPYIDEVILTTAIESKAKSVDELNITTIPFAHRGQLSNSSLIRFEVYEPGKAFWLTTSGYAQKQLDGSGEAFAAMARDAEAAVSPPLLSENNISNGGMIWIDVPANTSFISVNGSRGPGFAWISTAGTPIDGYMPPNLGTSQDIYSANELLWWRSLSPHVKYNISIGSTGSAKRPLFLTSVTFYSDLPPKKSSTNIGAIVGGVVGGVVGLLLLAGLGWWLWRRRRREPQEEGKFEVDGPITPFEPLPPPLRKDEHDVAPVAVHRADEQRERDRREQREQREQRERERQMSSTSGGSGTATPPSLKQQTLQALDSYSRHSPSSPLSPVTPVTGPNTPLGAYPPFALGTPVGQQSHASMLPIITPVTPGITNALLPIPESPADGTGTPSAIRTRPRAIDVGAVDEGSDEDAIDPPAYNPEWTRPRVRPQRPRIVVPQSKTPSSTLPRGPPT